MSEETIINGIDVSEYFTNHYDNEGKLYAVEYKGNPLELQNAIKCLQEKNKRLQMLSCANCGEKYLSPDGAELYEKNVQLQEENEGLKKQLEFSRTHKTVLDAERIKYKQALEEIRSYCDEQNLKADYTACYITNRIDEVLDEQK